MKRAKSSLTRHVAVRGTIDAVPGTLYVVSTPIGHLGDMTARAIDVLASVALVACEDTRVTGKLLKHFGIAAKMVSYHEHNEASRSEELVERLQSGADVALVSDAGTPLVSDPGYRLVRAARDAGVHVRSVPGASALLAALAASGMPTAPFTFFGFLPPKGTARRKAVEAASQTEETVVVFEAPTRIARLLSELAVLDGDRAACVLREMTKLHEEHVHDSLSQLAEWAEHRRFKGELALVMGPRDGQSNDRPVGLDELEGPFRALREEGLSARDASKRLAKTHGLKTRDIYQRFGK